MSPVQVRPGARTMWLHDIFVVPAARGGGAGRAEVRIMGLDGARLQELAAAAR